MKGFSVKVSARKGLTAGARRDRHRWFLALDYLENRTLLASGLVAAYGFNEGSGTTVGDASGNGNIGTISNATWVQGNSGSGLKFSGATNSYVTIPDSSSLDLSKGMTVEAWANPSSLSSPGANWCAVVAKEHRNSSNDISYALYAANGTGTPPAGHILVGSQDYGAQGKSVLALNTWTFLATTYDGTTLKTYVNGTQVGSKTIKGSITTTGDPLRIGGDWSSEMFTGVIDEVRVYNTALTQTQIQSDMNTPIDSVPPSVTMTAPASGSTVSGTTVTVSANATDNVAVAKVQFLLDGSNLGAPVTTAPYQYTWDTTSVGNGSHTLTAKATDTSGNSTTSSAISVTVNNPDVTPPTVSITSPAAGSSLSGTATLSANATDNVAVAKVQFQIDGTNYGPPLTSAPYSESWDTTTVTSGSHTIGAIATDTSGNTASASITVTVSQGSDTTPPTVTVTAPANNSTWAGAISLAATASDNVAVASVQFAVDGTNVGAPVTSSPYQVSWDSSKIGDGTHTITAKATDTSGNTATSSVTIQTANLGQFSSVINMPVNPNDNVAVVAMNMVLLDNGKILMWDGGPACIGALSPTVWDPVAGTFTFVPLETQPEVRDIFCSGQTVLADGRVLVAGGHDCTSPTYIGTAIANIFDPATNQWTFLPDMHDRRWYPTATTLPDGRALVTAGSALNTLDYDPIPEVYDPVSNTWTKLSSANQVIPNYPFVFVLPDGRVLAAGSDEAKMATYVLNVATQSWSVVDPTILDAGSAVQYLPGKIMKAGSSYLSAPPDNGGGVPSAATTYVIDMNQSSPAWQQTASMAYARTHLNLTILPDDTVLATGGSSDIGGVNPSNAVYPAELWSPVTQTWSTMASMQIPRLYHSTALLLPDGRVAVAGGGHNFYNSIAYPSSEIYSPPYLFKGARPTITSAPSTLAYGSNFFVGTPDGASIASVALIRNGSVTHSFNMDQTYVPLTFTQTSGGLTVQAPANANLAPPGYYMLFIVNSNGVPSVAPFVRLPAGYEDTQPPSAPTNLAANGTIGSVGLTWKAATDNVGVKQYNVYRSTTSGFTPSSANLIGTSTTTSYTDNVAAGTYYYLVTAQDAAGNVGPPSNQATGTSSPDTIAPTVSITSPAAGATVSGTVAVAANASDNVAVASVQFLLDGANYGSPLTTTPYSFSWNSATVANGTHTWAAVAQDTSGNTATSATVSFTVSNSSLPGLVASYGLDEGSGTTVNDSSTNKNNGTVSNATWATGYFGNALKFSGATNSYVTINDAASLDLTSGLTLEAWVNPSTLNSSGSNWVAAVAKEHRNSSNDIAYALYAAAGTGTPPALHLLISGTDVGVGGTSVLSLNTWTFLAGTYDGSTMRLYVNGTQVASKGKSGAITTTTDPLRLGGDWSSEMFTGLIDNVRVYNRALSSSELQSDMTTPISARPLTALVASAGGGGVPLTQALLAPVVDEAIDRWYAAGVSADRLQVLRDVRLRVQDMPSPYLGLTVGDQVWISRNAAGYGWFTNPGDDQAFTTGQVHGMDLLTTVMHEFGHVLGYDHDDGVTAMAEDLLPGTRRNPLVPDQARAANNPGVIAPTSRSAGSPPRSWDATTSAPVQLALRQDLTLGSSQVPNDTHEKGASLPKKRGARPALAIANLLLREGSGSRNQLGSSPEAPSFSQWAALDDESPASETARSPGIPLDWGLSPFQSKTRGKKGR
jgi:hypothetical protein